MRVSVYRKRRVATAIPTEARAAPMANPKPMVRPREGFVGAGDGG